MIGRRSSFGDRRRGRRLSWRLLRMVFCFAAVGAMGSYAYRIGESVGGTRVAQLEADLKRFQEANVGLRDRMAGLAERSREAEADLEDLRQRYASDVPRGDSAALLGRLQQQLEAGADPDRLAFLIDAAAQTDDCDDEPVTKRFVPQTPISGGPTSFVRFDGRVTVTGQGESWRNAEGLAEDWYDPAMPVRLAFRRNDGELTEVAGVLPMTHRMAIDGQEYRFMLVAGETSFVEVSAQRCELAPRPESANTDP
jgi:hypothetical protein